VLLKLPHRHGVFTIPKRIRPYFKFNRSLNKYLYQAAWQSWSELVANQCPDGTTGAIMALHTAGDLLAFHPHIHSLLLDGAVFPDGTFKQLEIDPERLQQLFADKVLAALIKVELLDDNAVQSMKNWPHSGFNIFLGESIPASATAQRLFTARYLKKCPISNERLRVQDIDGQATVNYIAYRNGSKETRTFTPLKFLAELQQHIPNMWEQTTRFFGTYSARARGAARKHNTPIIQLHAPEPTSRPSPRWAALMKRVFEIEPLTCSKCGASMTIKAFITDQSEIQRLCNNRGIISWRAPPPIHYTLPQAA
jgi:hypothetical protein